ncbi:hypothetical protein [Caballeronia sp. DA-9]|uniref:hypothetical protein n=1 Tax=Caballeronia sp. DA-9 TaxID=3436237 RepID=UPI003F6772F3
MKSLLAVVVAVIALVSVLLISNAPRHGGGTQSNGQSDNQNSKTTEHHASASGESSASPAAPLSECDFYAADPDDPERPEDPNGGRIAGVVVSQVDSKNALRACSSAMPGEHASLAQRRERYNRARVELQLGRYGAALPALQKLCSDSYGIACLRLAQAYRQGFGTLAPDDFIAYEYARAAQDDDVSAAGDVVHDLEPVVAVWKRVQAKELVRQLLIGKLDRIPDTASTRRYFYTLFVQSEKQNSQWYIALMSNQDYLHARQTIWPVLETRLRLSAADTKRIYQKITGDLSATTDWRSLFAAGGSSVFEVRTWLENADSVQVALGAQDAQKLFEWFNGCGGCVTARTRYQQNLAGLMRLWATRRPGADRADVVCPLLTDRTQPHCLPLDDYHGTDDSGHASGFVKHAAGQ